MRKKSKQLDYGICWICIIALMLVGCRGVVYAGVLTDGHYTIGVTLEGGTGRATITSPCELTVTEGKATAKIEWSSSNYDYMIVGQETYYPVNTEGNSVFEIPVSQFDSTISVVADTTAMSVPHEIAYELTFHSDQMKNMSGVLQKGNVMSIMLLSLLVICVMGLLILFLLGKHATKRSFRD